MNFSKIKNNTSDYEISIIWASDLGFDSYFENSTDEYLYLLNLTQHEIQEFFGDHLFFNVTVPLTFLYLLVLILGIFGNVTTCIVILKNPSMRNATNYYLFSLAVSDLILLIIGMILDFRDLWKMYPWIWGVTLCKVLNYSYRVAYNVSVLTVLALSFERYLAICHPLRFNAMKRLKRPIGFIICLWIVGLIFSSIHLFRHLTKYVIQFPSGFILDLQIPISCELTENLNTFAHEHLNFIFFFLLPMVVIVILYIKMGQKLRSSCCQISKLNSEKSGSFIRQFQSRRNTIRMLRVVVMVTFICWAPNNFIFLFEQNGSVQSLEYVNYHWVTFTSDLFFYASTVVNPIIYNLMSARYREAFKNTLRGKKKLVAKKQNSAKESSV